MSTLLVLPTRNPGHLFDIWVEAFNKLSSKPEHVSVIDSSSTDGTQEKARKAGFVVTVIDKKDFNHGSTRRLAVEKGNKYEFIVFMTQDAILSNPEAFQNILNPFEDSTVAAVCGRQIPRKNAECIEAHSRIRNYPEQSSVTTFEDRKTMGIKAAFLSNSFAAYRVSSLLDVGGFPVNAIFGEDMFVAAKLLKAGWRIAYAAEACVFHSHNYSLLQEMRRYFDMGVFHARETWIRKEFGYAENEGRNFVRSEVKYLWKHCCWKIPEAFLRTLLKYIGYKLGLVERQIPAKIKRYISMSPGYFGG